MKKYLLTIVLLSGLLFAQNGPRSGSAASSAALQQQVGQIQGTSPEWQNGHNISERMEDVGQGLGDLQGNPNANMDGVKGQEPGEKTGVVED